MEQVPRKERLGKGVESLNGNKLQYADGSSQQLEKEPDEKGKEADPRRLEK